MPDRGQGHHHPRRLSYDTQLLLDNCSGQPRLRYDKRASLDIGFFSRLYVFMLDTAIYDTCSVDRYLG